ncbi:cation-transporting P-type ATPase [Bradyrhizobium elkanii]|uniref:cation-transporting P-type ATPase n=1 Tax=Bradyrhizobium elkanii TaxID=29448 RepID=UPI002FF01369
MPLKPPAYGPAVEAFWREPADALLCRLDTQRCGLRQQEAEKRLARIGPNLAEPSGTRSILQKIVHRLVNPLIAILIVAAAVSGFSGDLASFVIITLVVGLSLTLDIVQEHARRSPPMRCDARLPSRPMSFAMAQSSRCR